MFVTNYLTKLHNLTNNLVQYINDFEEPMSEKEKSPWITINGTNIADSQIAIEYLTKVTIIYELKT